MRNTNPEGRKIASSETARDINRSVVLNRIRTNQLISRADLARQTGLQRSTVSLIVEQLVKERWVVEGAVAQLPRGRKPRLLMLNTARAGIIGVNMLPRATHIVLADLNANFKAQETIATLPDPEDFVAALCAHLRKLIKAHPRIAYEGIGVSVPGRVDFAAQKLVFAPNLGWRDVDLKTPLELATGLPVQIENAANACALSEVWTGPHEGVRDLIAVTVSEGIGTGVIANGRLVRGPSGAAGEFGHVPLNGDGPLCGCGSRGCWEVYASNAAAIRNYNCGTGESSASKSRKRSAASITDFNDLVLLVERGDVKAAEVIDRMAFYLGGGIAMLINGLAPSVITIIGEVTRLWGRVGPVVERTVSERARTHAGTRIVPSDATSQPRLKGTVAMVLQKHFQPHVLP
ncbi:MAG: ROK family transcriptional regulator [Acidobacteriota bacterium]|nr:ROK family transcriptional regulator [Acidobacteriota bacterium]